MPISPQHYNGQTVLLTGGVGYLGSIVLEQLLRLTEVKKVYLLVRGKRQHTASKRVEDLLCSPLFHMLHKEAEAGKRNPFNKVQAVEGDLNKPGLGVSEQDMLTLQQEVGIILHCAASLELDADVQMTLKHNYLGTMEVMRVASNFSNLCSFVHVSTYFVNNHLPRNSIVKEQIYPLPLSVAGTPVSHREYVAAMLAMDKQQANKHTTELMASINFTSTYAFGKHLTEQLVDETCIKPGVSRAIVRPSLIASVAFDPYPGYTNSYAGPGGYVMSYALGFFQGVKSLAYGSDTLLDLIPVDVVASLVITAGAAAAATYGSPSADRRAVIYHAASAESNPTNIRLCFDAMRKFWKANPSPLRLPATRHLQIKGEHKPNQAGVAAGAKTAKMKIKIVRGLLRLADKQRESRALKTGFKAFSVHNSLAYNKSFICSVDNTRSLLAQMIPEERQQWVIVWEEDDKMNREVYLYTFFAGVRRLLFHVNEPSRGVPHVFKHVPAAKHAAAQAVAASSGSGSSSRYESNTDPTAAVTQGTAATTGA